MSLHSSGKARLGPDFVCRIRGSGEWVKIVVHLPGYQEKAMGAVFP